MPPSPESLIESDPRISSLPEIFYLINEIISDPNSSFGEVAQVISSDPSLSIRLLKIVNSPFYSFPQKIDTITHAISIVGTEQLRDLALATTMLSQFRGISNALLDMNSFWRHSLACGIASRVLAFQCRQSNSERYFLIGMVHDVGRLVLLENYPDLVAPTAVQPSEEEPLLYEIELEHLGFHHGHVGAALCRSWHLPRLMECAIAYHHTPDMAEDFRLETAIVFLGNLIANAMGFGNSGDLHVPPINEDAWDRVGLSPSHLGDIWKQIQKQYQDTVNVILSG